MKKHYYIIGAIVGFGVLAAILILATVPTRSKTTGPVPTVSSDRNEALRGGSVEGQLVFSRQGLLWAWRGDTAKPLPLDPGKSIVANNTVRLVQPALSRDGAQLAYIRQDESYAELWVAQGNGTGPRLLGSTRGNGTPRSPNFISGSLWSFSPAWSPDGTEIAFLSDIGTDDLALWVTKAARSSNRQISNFSVGQGGLQRPNYSPTGDALVVAGYENGKSQIFTLKASGGSPQRLSDQPDGAYDPAWSPDGKLIAFIARRGNVGELWLMHADGSNPTRLIGQNSRTPVWSPDGRKLAFLSLKEGAFEIFTLDISSDGGSGSNLKGLSTNARLDGSSGLSWSK